MPLADNALTTRDKINIAMLEADKEALVNAASDIIEEYCNTKFKKDTYSLKLKPSGEKYLSVNYWNIESASIAYDEEAIEDYTILANRGMFYKADGWPDADDYLLEIELTAGFILPKDVTEENPRTLPQSVEYACILLAQEMYEQLQGGINVQRQTRGGISTTYFQNEDKLPAAVRSLLANWRVIPV
jgi:hypothetical protein